MGAQIGTTLFKFVHGFYFETAGQFLRTCCLFRLKWMVASGAIYEWGFMPKAITRNVNNLSPLHFLFAHCSWELRYMPASRQLGPDVAWLCPLGDYCLLSYHLICSCMGRGWPDFGAAHARQLYFLRFGLLPYFPLLQTLLLPLLKRTGWKWQWSNITVNLVC